MGMCQASERLVEYPGRNLTALRPTRYRTGVSSPPWELALIRLNERGYSDADIAAILSDLSPSAIKLMESNRTWTRDMVAHLLSPGSGGGSPWTKRAVAHHRWRLGLPPASPWSSQQERNKDAFSPGKRRAAARRLFQQSQGWFSLLPVYDEQLGYYEGTHYDRDLGYCRAVELRPTETRILTALWKHGAQTHEALAGRLKRRTLLNRGRSTLTRLLDLFLIRREGRPALLSLAPKLHPDIRDVTLDGHNDRLSALFGAGLTT